MRSGGCLCGAVRFAVDGPVRDVIVCHCADCLRWAGGPWPASAARRTDLTIAGGELLMWFAAPGSATSAERGSCTACGAALLWAAPDRETISFAAGALDDDAGIEVHAHIWTERLPVWDAIAGDAVVHRRGSPPDGPEPRWH